MAERPGEGEYGRARGPVGREGYLPHEGIDQVRWGPIMAGVFVMLSVATVLGLLGLAVQAAATDPMAPGEAAGWGWAIWGIIVLIVSFGAGGWLAARAAALRGERNGLLNGAMVWAVGVPVMFFVLTTMFGTVMGPAAMMARATDMQLEQVYAIPAEQFDQQEQEQPQPQPQERERADDDQQAINIATWGTLIALILGLGAAAGGGYFAGRQEDVSRPRGGYGGGSAGPGASPGPGGEGTYTPPPTER